MHLKRLINEMGWNNTLAYIVNKVLKSFSENISLTAYYFIAQPVLKKALLPLRRGKNIEVRKIIKNDPVINSIDRNEIELNARFESGAVCFAAFHDNILIGFIWITTGEYQESIDRCIMVPFPPGEIAWDFDIYILPEERIGFAFARLWDEANLYLNERHINWTVSRISAYNPNSLVSHERLGAKKIGKCYFFTIGSWQVMVSSVRPFFHLSTSTNNMPRIVISLQKVLDR